MKSQMNQLAHILALTGKPLPRHTPDFLRLDPTKATKDEIHMRTERAIAWFMERCTAHLIRDLEFRILLDQLRHPQIF